jgi:RNA polymerase sigma-70 factor (ECF subfamily)
MHPGKPYNTKAMDEKHIINQILSGDTGKYRLLLERYQPGLIRHCLVMVHDYEAANDITQQATIKAFFQLKRYDNSYRFSTWLYKIANNICIDFLKKRKNISLDDIPEPASTILSPEEQAEEHEAAKKLHKAVAQLPVKYQSVISLYYWEERSYEEIANIMQKPIGTIRTWIRRAKEQLKEDLHGQV